MAGSGAPGRAGFDCPWLDLISQAGDAIHCWIWDSKAGFSRPWQDLLLQGMIWQSMAGFIAPRHDLAVHGPICMVFTHFGALDGGYGMIQHSTALAPHGANVFGFRVLYNYR